jgi:hypothetical protein
MNNVPNFVELTDAELDAVAGGQNIANNNNIGVGVLANILGGPAFLLQRA